MSKGKGWCGECPNHSLRLPAGGPNTVRTEAFHLRLGRVGGRGRGRGRGKDRLSSRLLAAHRD